MKQAKIVLSDAFMAHGYLAEVLQLSNQAFDLPAASVSSQRLTILDGGFDEVAAVRSDQLDAAPLQTPIQRIAIVGPSPIKRFDFARINRDARVASIRVTSLGEGKPYAFRRGE